jgi:hypothetical protein
VALAERTLGISAPKIRADLESVMGLLSWLGLRRPAEGPGGLRRLVRTGHDKPRIERIKEAAAADVARVEEDDKYFGSDAPAKREDDL